MKNLVSAMALSHILADCLARSLSNSEHICDAAVTNREERLQKALMCEKKVLGAWLVSAETVH